MKVKDVMTKEVRTVELPGTRADALEVMKKVGVSALPVVRKGTGELVGMIVAQKLVENPNEDQLAMLVDKNVATVGPDDDLKTAVQVFLDARVRRLPVVKDGALAGVLAVRDVVYRAIAEMNLEKPAAEYMRPHIIALWDGTPLKPALHLIALSGFHVVPVIDSDGKLVGTVSDVSIFKLSDIEVGSKMSQMSGRSEGDSWSWDTEARIYITKKELVVPDKTVKEVMSKEIVTITRKTPVSRAAQLMKQKNAEQAMVLSPEEKLLGIVRDVDLIKVLVE
ncbi:MAG: CBS domain-containing protein [Candidatus Hadarchaeales archaeon]